MQDLTGSDGPRRHLTLELADLTQLSLTFQLTLIDCELVGCARTLTGAAPGAKNRKHIHETFIVNTS